MHSCNVGATANMTPPQSTKTGPYAAFCYPEGVKNMRRTL